MLTERRQPNGQTVHFEPPRKKRARGDALMNVNLTPAIDITFNLLIFFVVATTFKAAEGVLRSETPAEQGVLEATPLPISPIRVRVRQTGPGYNDYRLKIDNRTVAPQSFLELTLMLEELQQMSGFDQETPVIIFAKDDTQWDLVVRCFNAIRRANNRPLPAGQLSTGEPFKNITFAAASG